MESVHRVPMTLLRVSEKLTMQEYFNFYTVETSTMTVWYLGFLDWLRLVVKRFFRSSSSLMPLKVGSRKGRKEVGSPARQRVADVKPGVISLTNRGQLDREIGGKYVGRKYKRCTLSGKVISPKPISAFHP